MNARIESDRRDLPLAQQREQLLRRSSALRAAVGRDLQVLTPSFAFIDRVRDGARTAAEHRGLIAAGAAVGAAVLLRHPRTATRLGLRAISLLEIARRAQPLVRQASRWFQRSRRA